MTQNELLEWSRLETERRTLARQVATIRNRQAELESKFEAALQQSGKTVLRRHGYTLAIIPGRANVSWSSEFVKACGADAAQAIRDRAAESARSVFVITPPQSLESPE